MLRRIQPIASPAADASGAAARTPSDEPLQSDGERVVIPRTDRRKSDRRSMDTLRAEALRTVISQVEDRNFGGIKDRVSFRPRMKASRIFLLLVALLAGGAATYLALQRDEPAPQVEVAPEPTVVEEPRTQILVARSAIGVGERLSAATVEWQEWPDGALRADYITQTDSPDAMTDMSGSTARFEFFPGEPIRADKLVSGGQGYMSAALPKGQRGVSVTVAAEAASGGFIVPNDHVDVLLTRATEAGPNAQTILHNVRVLAIGDRLGEEGATGAPENPDDPKAKVFENQAIATLALDRTQTEIITSASGTGRLSLALRSMDDFAETSSAAPLPINEQIRMTSPFWAN